MNRTIMAIAIIISLFLFHAGGMLADQTSVLMTEAKDLRRKNEKMRQELIEKNMLKKKEPLKIAQEFGFLINLVRIYEGTDAEILLGSHGDKEPLEENFLASDFKGVRMLPVTLKIAGVDGETRKASILGDIYMLEKQTDLKINEIDCNNNTVVIKGEIYGL